MDYGVYSLHSACLRTISARCQIQSTPRNTKFCAKIYKILDTMHVFGKKVVILHNILLYSMFFTIKYSIYFYK